jgi:hypothetical protein
MSEEILNKAAVTGVIASGGIGEIGRASCRERVLVSV